MRFAHDAELSMCAMMCGDGWLIGQDAEPISLLQGDVALVRGPAPFVLTDRPGSEPTIVVYGPDRCTSTETGEDLSERNRLGPRSWGSPSGGGTSTMLVGACRASGVVCDRLLAALPPILVVPADGTPCPEFELLAREIAADRPGQQVILDRLLDLLLVATLRDWFDRPEAEPPAWYRALGDPVVGTVLRAVHDAPARPWTVAALAAEAGVSRATLAKRFTELVGEPPLSYLTGWRMTLAADLLRHEDATVAAVAAKVGYADGFAFSAAFKRVRGVRPSTVRTG